MWSIFQLADLLAMNDKLRWTNPDDERINIPSDPDHYWHHRMHLNLETLLKENEFNEMLRKFITESGRNQ
jgi:4-alpha-glucanotransferase